MLAALAHRGERAAGDAEEDEQDDQRQERRDVAQSVANEAPHAASSSRSLLTVLAGEFTHDPALLQSPRCGRPATERFRARSTGRRCRVRGRAGPARSLTTSSLAPTIHAARRFAQHQHPGGQVSHLASATFCWLPPDRLVHSVSTVGGRIDSAST